MSEKSENEEIKIEEERYGISCKSLLDDLFGRRYTDYYTWMIKEIDHIGGLLTLGRMVIIGGQHGSGKTTFITELAKNNAKTKPTMLIPLEMGMDFTVMMLACNMFNNQRGKEVAVLGYGEVEEGYLYKRPEEDRKLFKACVEELYKDYPYLYINNPKTNSFEDLVEMIRDYYGRFGIKFFIIDHLHQLDSSQEKDGETAFYSKVAKELKILAETLGIALLCIVQLTKLANGGKGELDLSAFKGTSDFSGSSHRAAMIKKPSFIPLKDAECKRFIVNNANTGILDDLGIDDRDNLEKVRAFYEEQFKKDTRHIREILFLKTRGRDGGTATIQMKKGEFKFLQFGSYVYKRF